MSSPEDIPLKPEKQFEAQPQEIIEGLNVKGLVLEKGVWKGKVTQDSGIDADTTYSGWPASTIREPRDDFERKHLEDVKKAFANISIIDLGAGNDHYGYEIACTLGSKGYIGVEPIRPYNSLLAIEKFLQENKTLPRIPYTIVKEDALNFLKRIPNDSVGVFCFGLDIFVLSTQTNDETNYYRECKKEIDRVIKPASGELVTGDTELVGSNLKITPHQTKEIIQYLRDHPGFDSFLYLKS